MHNVMLYATALINLEKKLMKKPDLLNQISNEISLINKQEFFDIYHSNSIARLAELYKNTLGSLNPTIMVRGEQIYLTKPSHCKPYKGFTFSRDKSCIFMEIARR